MCTDCKKQKEYIMSIKTFLQWLYIYWNNLSIYGFKPGKKWNSIKPIVNLGESRKQYTNQNKIQDENS